MRSTSPLLVGLAWLAIFANATIAGQSQAAASRSDPEEHLLRYKFRPGETIRWEVLDQKCIQVTDPKATQITETVLKSVKVWRVVDVEPDGTATFENSVESVEARNKLSSGQEVRYNSLTDKEPPPGFQHIAESIGVPQSVVTINTRGEILRRDRKPLKAAAQNEGGRITLPLPEEAVPAGHTWSFRDQIDVTLEGGTVKKVKILQTFKLKSVKTGVATIEVATRILTPIHTPALEAKLIDKESSGTVRFDVDAGRVLRQQTDVDRRVVGFVPNHPASCLHYRTRFTEELLPEKPKTASRQTSPDAKPKG